MGAPIANHSSSYRFDSSTRIQPAGLRDLMEMYRLEKRCFPIDSWPIIDVLFALLIPRILCIKAVYAGRMVGFVVGQFERGVGWIATFGVDPEFRRHGLGSALLKAIEQELGTATMRLCVRESNLAAIQLYEKFGYKSLKTWKKYYRGGEDAIVMEKKSILDASGM